MSETTTRTAGAGRLPGGILVCAAAVMLAGAAIGFLASSSAWHVSRAKSYVGLENGSRLNSSVQKQVYAACRMAGLFIS